MKKLSYALLASFLLACNSGSKNTQTTADNKANNVTAANMVSINGISETDARDMVRDFTNDQTSMDPHTSFWFSQKMIDAALKTATASGQTVDGIRIHLAKRAGKNSIVLLLTTDGGQHPNFPNKRIHKEFFSPMSDLLGSIAVRNIDEHYEAKGADLYTTTCSQGPCNSTNNNTIDCKTAHQWAVNFVNAHGGQPVKMETKSVWYPIGLFEKIKEDIADGTTGTRKGDGFRIYLVKKDDGKFTFVLVPTYELPGGNHKDDYTCYATRKFVDPYDHGEECPTFCDGVIVP